VWTRTNVRCRSNGKRSNASPATVTTRWRSLIATSMPVSSRWSSARPQSKAPKALRPIPKSRKRCCRICPVVSGGSSRSRTRKTPRSSRPWTNSMKSRRNHWMHGSKTRSRRSVAVTICLRAWWRWSRSLSRW